MFTGNKKLIAAYISFVGIPALALVAVLDAGHNLQAPPAVGGAWRIQADLQPLVSSPCIASLVGSEEPVLTILQSGRYLVVALNGIQGAGRIEHATVTAGELRPANDRSCGTQGSGYLQANLEGSPEHSLLAGVIGVNGCSSCAAVPFRATRLPQARTWR